METGDAGGASPCSGCHADRPWPAQGLSAPRLSMVVTTDSGCALHRCRLRRSPGLAVRSHRSALDDPACRQRDHDRGARTAPHGRLCRSSKSGGRCGASSSSSGHEDRYRPGERRPRALAGWSAMQRIGPAGPPAGDMASHLVALAGVAPAADMHLHRIGARATTMSSRVPAVCRRRPPSLSPDIVHDFRSRARRATFCIRLPAAGRPAGRGNFAPSIPYGD